jgi:hypothetical protein
MDAHQHIVSSDMISACGGNPACTHVEGGLSYQIVQPARYFWLLQGIETTIYGLLAGALIGLTY